MRMRKKKHGAERLAAQAKYLLEKPESPISSPLPVFGRAGEMHLEIGCGKGGFACGMAAAHPEVNFFAFEKVPDVMVIAVEGAESRREERSEDNLRFMIGDANDLPAWFAPHSLDTIYLNFSDPWPKKKHAKRRLTHRRLLQMYFTLLRDGGHLCFKTDNRPLFDFTLQELEALSVTPDYVTYDLHNSPYNEGNIRTEYEENFSRQGFPINALRLTVHTSDEASAE
jgi:tRNA (guanine-N7-)-methyltransferase